MKDYQLNIQLAEQHPFQVSKADSFLCQTCSKPRALHAHTGFIPAPDTSPLPFIRIRTANLGANLVCGPLTDEKIEKYQQSGWYSEAFREARRSRMARKRKGNFVESSEGRLIYCPG